MNKKSSQEKILLSIRIVLIVGMILSVFLLYQHFNTKSSAWCNLGEGMNCDVVNKSPYANIDGIFYLMTFDLNWGTTYYNISNLHWFWDLITTNALLGFLTLLFIFSLTFRLDQGLWWINKEKSVPWLRGLLIFSVFYGFLLFLLQKFVIKSLCIYCLGLDVTMIAALVLSFNITPARRKRKS